MKIYFFAMILLYLEYSIIIVIIYNCFFIIKICYCYVVFYLYWIKSSSILSYTFLFKLNKFKIIINLIILKNKNIIKYTLTFNPNKRQTTNFKKCLIDYWKTCSCFCSINLSFIVEYSFFFLNLNQKTYSKALYYYYY